MRPAETAAAQQMSPYHAHSFVIVGLTREGKRFRPSDWAERLAGIMAVFGAGRRMAYSPYVQPGNRHGEKCVFVDARLHDVEPMAYTFISNFAKDNELQVETWTPGSD